MGIMPTCSPRPGQRGAEQMLACSPCPVRVGAERRPLLQCSDETCKVGVCSALSVRQLTCLWAGPSTQAVGLRCGGARSAPSRCVHFSLDHPRQVTIDQDEEMDPDFCYVGATRLCHDTCLCGSRLSRSVPMKYMRNVMHAAMKSSWLCPCPDIRLIRLETRGA